MPADLVVRPTSPFDNGQQIRALAWLGWLSGHRHLFTQAEIDEIQSAFPHSILEFSWPLPPTGVIFVAVLGTEYVGAINLRPEPSDGTYALIEPMSVNEDHQRHGVGTKLWQFAEDVSRRRGDRGLQVWAMNGNPKAMAFYPKVGCRAVATGWVRLGLHVEPATGFHKDF
jgi:GNAT superfamily N-acetyltransferase